MTYTARGKFEVEMQPLEESGMGPVSGLGRLRLEKRFFGDLEGESLGQMLTGMTPVEGSAGYVAIERVSGVLNGRSGSFLLQHNGLMGGGEQRLVINIIPDSGLEELLGITGSMTIQVDAEGHRYEMHYSLPD